MMYTEANPAPNLRGGSQLPNPNEWNLGYLPPQLYIDVDECGHRLRAESPLESGSPLTFFPRAAPENLIWCKFLQIYL